MELDGVYWQGLMLNTHYDAFVCSGRFETVRHFNRTETMVTACMERIFQAGKTTGAIMSQLRSIAVHDG